MEVMTIAYRDEIATLGADHHYDFDGDTVDQIGSSNGSDTGVIYTDGAIALDSTNCMTTNGLTDFSFIASTSTINNAAQQRKAISLFYETTAFQAPPTMIYSEGDATTVFQLIMGFGNNFMYEVTEPTNFPEGLQIYGPPFVPNRVYHICAIFLGNTQGNEIKLFIDGVEQTNADPVDRQPDTADLDSRSRAEIGDTTQSGGIGGGAVLQQAARNGRYQHLAIWSDKADADLTDTEVREILVEQGALAEDTITTDTEANMQTDMDALTVSRTNVLCDVEVDAVTGAGDFTLTSDLVFDDLTSIHFRYNGTADQLTIVNVSGGNATIGSAPFGGTLVIANRQTLTVTVIDAVSGSAISGARVYIEADTGGDLTAGTEIMNTTTNGSGVATVSFDYTADQPIIGRVRKGSASTYYKTNAIPGPLTSTPLDVTVLMIPDE